MVDAGESEAAIDETPEAGEAGWGNVTADGWETAPQKSNIDTKHCRF